MNSSPIHFPISFGISGGLNLILGALIDSIMLPSRGDTYVRGEYHIRVAMLIGMGLFGAPQVRPNVNYKISPSFEPSQFDAGKYKQNCLSSL